MVLPFELVNEILNFDHSNVNYLGAMLPLEELYCMEIFLGKGKDKQTKHAGKAQRVLQIWTKRRAKDLDFVKFSRNNFPSSFGNVLDCIGFEHVSIYLKVITGRTPAEFLLANPSPRSLAAFSRVSSSSRHLIFSRAAWKKITLTVKRNKLTVQSNKGLASYTVVIDSSYSFCQETLLHICLSLLRYTKAIG